MFILTNYNSPFHTGQFLFKSEHVIEVAHRRIKKPSLTLFVISGAADAVPCDVMTSDSVWVSGFDFTYLCLWDIYNTCQWELKKEVYVKVNVSFLVLSIGFHTFFPTVSGLRWSRLMQQNILYFLLKVEKKRIDGIKSWKWFPALFCSLKAQQVSITVT